MALIDYKMSEEDANAKGVVSLPDNPSAQGIGAAQLKAAFDNLSKNVVGKNLNSVIDALISTSGAEEIGASVGDMEGSTVADILRVLAQKGQSYEVHLEDKNNPHKVTASQVGAVAEGNITSNLADSDQGKIPTCAAVNGGIALAGGGDMMKSIYDPTNKAQDIFAYVDEKVANIPTPDVSGQIDAHNTSPTAHSGMFAPAYTYGTTDMTAGTSELEDGKLYFVYE